MAIQTEASQPLQSLSSERSIAANGDGAVEKIAEVRGINGAASEAIRIDPELKSPELFLNRELTWLAFNRRVLAEARDERNPLLERVKFLGHHGVESRRILHEAHRRPQAAGRSPGCRS